MSNVINFEDLKKDKKVLDKINDPTGLSQYDFEKESNEFLEIFNKGDWELVARNHIDATAMSKIILDNDDTISHVEVVMCISRLSEFFKIKPISKDGKEIRLCSSGLAPAYLKHLYDNGLIDVDSNGIVTFKQDNE